MSTIGRKIYINWGNIILAIEKIQMTDERLKELHIEKGKEVGCPISLYNINEFLGCRVEEHLQSETAMEVEFSRFLTNDEYWITDEEDRMLYLNDIKKERQEFNIVISEENDYPEYYVLTPDEYDNLYENKYSENNEQCLSFLVRIRCDDESFWGLLFRQQDVDNYKTANIGQNIKFIACNNTLNGQIIGHVYNAKINDKGDIEI